MSLSLTADFERLDRLYVPLVLSISGRVEWRQGGDNNRPTNPNG